MTARFAFSALFSAVGVAAAFDDAIIADAAAGRVNRAFAMLAATEYGLPLVKADGNPVNKPAFLKLADAFRAADGKGHGVNGRNRRIEWGTALDAIALHLRAGATPTPEQVQAYTDAGQYRDGAAWAAAIPAPAPKKAEGKPAKAPAVGKDAEPAPDMVNPAPVAAAAPAPVAAPAAPEGETLPDSVEVGADVLFDAVMLAIQTGAFTPEELAAIGAAVADAQTAALADVQSLPALMAASGAQSGAVAH